MDTLGIEVEPRDDTGMGNHNIFTQNRYRPFIAMSTLLMILSGCNQPSEQSQVITEGGSTAVITTPDSASAAASSESASTPAPISSTHAQPEDLSKVICDPFANNPTHVGSEYDIGLAGKMAYLSPSMPRYSTARDYFRYGNTIDATLFMTQLSIPTRSFELGFSTQTGQVIKNSEGNTLYEYFALQLETELLLAPQDTEGQYQFALLADDGATLEMNLGKGYVPVVNNDGNHPTRMGCSTQPVTVTRGQSIPMRIFYYQGPRYHIALNLMWRPWSGSGSDSACGTSGNSLFWDSTRVPSAPTTTFQGLLDRGWSVVPSANLILPRAIAHNPCVNVQTAPSPSPSPSPSPTPVADTTPPTVSNISTQPASWLMILTWYTSEPTIGMVNWGRTSSVPSATEWESTYSTSHTMTIDSLSPSTPFYFQITSKDAAGNSASSSIFVEYTY